MADDASIVIKKIKKGGHAAHGGAWKVAYADFVTAMMAFFLLLWLLSSASESQKEGIAEYFTPTIGIKDEAGIGFDGGTSPSEDGEKKSDLAPVGIVMGQPQTGQLPEDPKPALQEQDAESQLFEKAEAEIKQAIESDPNLREITENILMEQTPEGLKIDIIDDGKKPMFHPGGADITEFGKKVLWKLSEVIIRMPNHISITGNTDASTFPPGARYTNWELSSDRANAARRFLETTKMEKDRVAKIVGKADKDPLLPDNPSSPRNRRISIILLRGSHLKQMLQDEVVPRGLLSAPRAVDPKKEEKRRRESDARKKERARKEQLKKQQEENSKQNPLKEKGLPSIPEEKTPGMEGYAPPSNAPSFYIKQPAAAPATPAAPPPAVRKDLPELP